MPCRHLLLTLALVLFTAGTACADLDVYLRSLSVNAEADLGGFRTQVGAHFGASRSQLDLVFLSVREPADAVLCFWLARQSRQPVEVVVREYRRRQGWGALAQSLGIKPGSPAFQALKSGELEWHPAARADGHGKPGKRSGKERGNRKEKKHS